MKDVFSVVISGADSGETKEFKFEGSYNLEGCSVEHMEDNGRKEPVYLMEFVSKGNNGRYSKLMFSTTTDNFISIKEGKNGYLVRVKKIGLRIFNNDVVETVGHKRDDIYLMTFLGI